MRRIRRALLKVVGPLFGFGEAGALNVTHYPGQWLRFEIDGRFVWINGAKSRAFTRKLTEVIAQWDEAVDRDAVP